jgi:hypothetical protein
MTSAAAGKQKNLVIFHAAISVLHTCLVSANLSHERVLAIKDVSSNMGNRFFMTCPAGFNRPGVIEQGAIEFR